MAINVTTANNQAGQLNTYAQQLRNAKTQLTSYKVSIQLNWAGQEVIYITRGIEQTISQIDAVIKELESLSADVKNVASTIKREEDAAAAAARERQHRINEAQTAYNNAVNEYNGVLNEMDKLEQEFKKNPLLRYLPNYAQRYDELKKNIEKAAQKCDDCKRVLSAAKG